LILWVAMKMNGVVMGSSWASVPPMGSGLRVHDPRRPGCGASAKRADFAHPRWVFLPNATGGRISGREGQ